jgi:SET family sugar efflux transporter-like MFS transporter
VSQTQDDRLIDIIWRSPVCRGGFISLIFFGFGVSCTIPFLTLFFVEELSISLSTASLYYLTGVATPVVGFLIGRFSDSKPDRMPLVRICCLIQVIGWLIIASTTMFAIPILVNVFMLSLGAAASPLLFAAIRDEALHKSLPRQNQVMTTVRLSYVAAWAIGPILGSWISEEYGLRALFSFAAVSFGLSMIPLIGVRVPRFVTVATLPSDTPIRAGVAMAPLLIFCLLATLAQAGTSMKFSFLPVYAEEDLAISGAILGLIIGIQPLMEVPLMVIAGYFADRIGAKWVLLVGIAFGLVSHIVYANSGGAFGLFAGQVLGAAMHAAVIGVGISVSQALYPRGIGVASSLFYGSLGLSGTVAGGISAIAVDRLGLPHVFYIPAVLCGIAFAGIILLGPAIKSSQRAFAT